jgi:GAF domain-containing protein
VVPLADGPRSIGALVLGRARQRYEASDEDLAGVLGRVVSRLVVNAKLDREIGERPELVVAASPQADREWADEPELTRS